MLPDRVGPPIKMTGTQRRERLAVVDFRSERLRTRRVQGLPDDLPADLVDQVVAMTRACVAITHAGTFERDDGPAVVGAAADDAVTAEAVRHV